MTAMSEDFDNFTQLTTTELEQMISEQELLNYNNQEGGVHYGIQESSAAQMMYKPTVMHNMGMDHMTAHRPSPVSGAVPSPAPPAHAHSRSQPKSRKVNPASDVWVEVIEQPKQRGLRFRYQCEGRSAGSIPGEHSSAEKKTFPTIKIHNYHGQAIIVVSCVTKDPEPRCKPHPHSLVGRDCKKGVCTVRVKDASVVSFPQLGIQCAKKKDVEEALKLRKEINVDPYQTGFDHASSNIDLNVVRLCFQVFLPDSSGKVTQVVNPVVSVPIHDKKALNDLIICRVDKSSGKPKGGDEVFLLCEKVGKDDIKVRFFEEENDELLWEGFGDFGQGDVHRQYAIVFKTPKYKEEFISRPVIVNMQLYRPSDCEASEPIQFTYMPEDPDPDRIEEKRKRKGDWLSRMMPSSGSSDGASSTNSSVKESLRHKLKANRRIKQEPQMETEGPGAVQGMSLSSRGSGSSLEPLSSTSSASHSFRTSDNTGMGNVIVANSGQPHVATVNIDANKLIQQITLQQQQQQQQQQQASNGGGQMSGVSGASGSSQPGSLDSLLNFMGTMPISSLMNAIDTNTIQSFLEQGVSFSSGDGGSNVSVPQDLNSSTPAGADQGGQGQPTDFLDLQASLDAFNKTS
ncbi:transcription factor RelB-like isoform X2 [Babylonia areolata]|uniref:transcription factor RelB-like isoform X2 n=1 Tax=Babylonia areolata TaxID=304850 RepID=UPI003FD517DA